MKVKYWQAPYFPTSLEEGKITPEVRKMIISKAIDFAIKDVAEDTDAQTGLFWHIGQAGCAAALVVDKAITEFECGEDMREIVDAAGKK